MDHCIVLTMGCLSARTVEMSSFCFPDRIFVLRPILLLKILSSSPAALPHLYTATCQQLQILLELNKIMIDCYSCTNTCRLSRVVVTGERSYLTHLPIPPGAGPRGGGLQRQRHSHAHYSLRVTTLHNRSPIGRPSYINPLVPGDLYSPRTSGLASISTPVTPPRRPYLKSKMISWKLLIKITLLH